MFRSSKQSNKKNLRDLQVKWGNAHKSNTCASQTIRNGTGLTLL